MQLEDAMAGKQGPCPSCGKLLLVPDAPGRGQGLTHPPAQGDPRYAAERRTAGKGGQEITAAPPAARRRLASGPNVGGGVLMMVVAAVWFAVGLAVFERILIYPPLLFLLGVVSLARGLAGGE
jgi:hypothetical protein